MIRSWVFLLIFLLHAGIFQAQESKTNQPGQLNKPYVVLVSLDGFRYDYVERFNPPHLTKFIEEGVQAESLVPCFPSKTFPNHYSIATGMRPMQHRLIGNEFFDPQRQKIYAISKRDIVEDGSWYAGTPIWVNAELQGMVSASYFYVASEADIKGVRPSYYFKYDGSVPNDRRVDQVLAWLKLPPANRPHMIALYFSDMDDAGHLYGPNNDEELGKVLMKLDEDLGRLFDGVRKLDIPVNIILVSDHGMAEVKVDQLIPIEPLESDSEYILTSEGALLHIYLKEGIDADAVCQRLQSLEWADHYSVCKASEFPYYLGPNLDPRVGDILVMPDFPYYFTRSRTLGFLKNIGRTVMGEHGFATVYPEMRGIFYARGPAFNSGAKVGSVENIHIYPLICKILDLSVPPEVEGSLEVLTPLLK
ncbi:MAG: alkaline phosphatase family protein [Lewinellaceae bacterium]|nr:alkaline phosphatase family protein [Lewinellaceae bacterium]